MEQRCRADALGLALEDRAVGQLRLFELLDGLKMAVDERHVGQRPQMLGGLEFGRIRRQEEQMNMVRDTQALSGVPAGAVQDEYDLFVWPCPCLARKGGEFGFKERNAHTRGQMKQRPTR
jgi:hypothetical protein